MTALYFVIVGKEDKPLFNVGLDLLSKHRSAEEFEKEKQFIVHSSLDVIEKEQYKCTSYLLHKNPVDRFQEFFIYSFVTAGFIKFILLYEGHKKQTDSINSFFEDVYELYIKHTLNPFYKYNSEITCETFHDKVLKLSKKLN